MRTDHSKMYFHSGKSFEANGGILGLSETLSITEGYDRAIVLDDEQFADAAFNEEERQEIANYMVDLWKQWGMAPN